MQQTGAFVEHVICTLAYISQLYLRWIQSNIPVRLQVCMTTYVKGGRLSCHHYKTVRKIVIKYICFKSLVAHPLGARHTPGEKARQRILLALTSQTELTR